MKIYNLARSDKVSVEGKPLPAISINGRWAPFEIGGVTEGARTLSRSILFDCFGPGIAREFEEEFLERMVSKLSPGNFLTEEEIKSSLLGLAFFPCRMPDTSRMPQVNLSFR
jgi:hypothetical protein